MKKFGELLFIYEKLKELLILIKGSNNSKLDK